MGKKQRDCAGCGAPVGYLGREYCCLCMRRIREEAAKAPCPDCGKDRVLNSDTGRCRLCSRRCTQCGGPVRARDAVLCRDCRRRAAAAGRQAAMPAVRQTGSSSRRHRLVRFVFQAQATEGPTTHLPGLRSAPSTLRSGDVLPLLAGRPRPAPGARGEPDRPTGGTTAVAR